jgi:hypothetical protein
VTEFHEPLFVTVDPETGEAAFDFTGHVKAEGLDLDAGETATPPDDRRVRWLRGDGSSVADLLAYGDDTANVDAIVAFVHPLAARVSNVLLRFVYPGGDFGHFLLRFDPATRDALALVALPGRTPGTFETVTLLDSDAGSTFARSVQEDVHLLGASGEPALQNGWVNFGGGFTEAGFYLDTVGRVHLQGTIKSGAAALDTLLFTLPVGYRPAARVGPFPVASNLSYGEVDVHANGDVFLRVGHANYLALDSVSFRAA